MTSDPTFRPERETFMFKTLLDLFARNCDANGATVLFERPGEPDISFAEAMTQVTAFAGVLLSLIHI